MLDGLQEIFFTLRQNKLRTLLTAFGVFWGIFMLILLLGSGRGMQNGVMTISAPSRWTSSSCWTGDTSVAYNGMGLGRKIQLDQADIEAVSQQITGIRFISGDRCGRRHRELRGKNSNAHMLGIPDEFFVLKTNAVQFRPEDNPLDVDETRKVVASAPPSPSDCSPRV